MVVVVLFVFYTEFLDFQTVELILILISISLLEIVVLFVVVLCVCVCVCVCLHIFLKRLCVMIFSTVKYHST